MSVDTLRWVNLVVCVLSLVPSFSLMMMLWNERSWAKKRLLLNGLLVSLVGVLGIRSIIQITIYIFLLASVAVPALVINTSNLVANLISTISVWFLWLYINHVRKGC